MTRIHWVARRCKVQTIPFRNLKVSHDREGRDTEGWGEQQGVDAVGLGRHQQYSYHKRVIKRRLIKERCLL
jgi:hypothetical protein